MPQVVTQEGIQCPRCGSGHGVTDTDPYGRIVLRKRVCDRPACATTFRTKETITETFVPKGLTLPRGFQPDHTGRQGINCPVCDSHTSAITRVDQADGTYFRVRLCKHDLCRTTMHTEKRIVDVVDQLTLYDE